MPNHSRYLSRHFSEDHCVAEIDIKVSGECDSAELLAGLKKLLAKRNRRIAHHGGSRTGYCIELNARG